MNGVTKMKQEDLPKVSKAEFLRTCSPQLTPSGIRFIDKSIVAELYDEWDAIKLINLPNIDVHGILLSVLDEKFLPKLLLHEFALRCAEWALPFADGHYVHDVEAIRIKRLWLFWSIERWVDEMVKAYFHELDILRNLIYEWEE